MSAIVGASWSVGLEEGADGAFRAHALSLIGCEEVGVDANDAVDRFAVALQGRIRDLARMGRTVPSHDTEIEITVDEWISTPAMVAAGETVACFERDREPLQRTERLAGLHLLGDLRGRLLPHIRRARNEQLEAIGHQEVNVRAILDELAKAQWWTLTRLGASPLAEVPDQVVGRLDTAMALVVQTINGLEDSPPAEPVTLEGEEWTPRKVLRRLLWLEWSLGDAALRHLEAAEGVR